MVQTIVEAKKELDQLGLSDYSDVNPGWYPLLAGFFRQLKQIIPTLTGSDIGRIKQKFAHLRIYFNISLPPEAIDLLALVEYEAAHTCEFCGKSGSKTTNNGHWLVISCGDCWLSAKEEAKNNLGV